MKKKRRQAEKKETGGMWDNNVTWSVWEEVILFPAATGQCLHHDLVLTFVPIGGARNRA